MKDFQIHRLVAEAFILNPLHLPEVNHKDEDKKNNCVMNLEWCSHKYNSNYGTILQRRLGSRNYEDIMCDVAQYDSSGALIKVFRSQTMAAMELGVTPEESAKLATANTIRSMDTLSRSMSPR